MFHNIYRNILCVNEKTDAPVAQNLTDDASKTLNKDSGTKNNNKCESEDKSKKSNNKGKPKTTGIFLSI